MKVVLTIKQGPDLIQEVESGPYVEIGSDEAASLCQAEQTLNRLVPEYRFHISLKADDE